MYTPLKLIVWEIQDAMNWLYQLSQQLHFLLLHNLIQPIMVLPPLPQQLFPQKTLQPKISRRIGCRRLAFPSRLQYVYATLFCDGSHKGSEFPPMKFAVAEQKEVALCPCNRPQVPSSVAPLRSPACFQTTSATTRVLYLLAVGHKALLGRSMAHGTLRPHSPHVTSCNRQSDLVLQDQRINTVPALHAAENLDVVFAGVTQVITPVVHEQAGATSAGSRRELFDRREEPNGLIVPAFCHSAASHGGSCLHPSFHDSPPSCWYRVTCSWVQNVTVASTVAGTLASSHDRSIHGSRRHLPLMKTCSETASPTPSLTYPQ